jgi:hypothetical protein
MLIAWVFSTVSGAFLYAYFYDKVSLETDTWNVLCGFYVYFSIVLGGVVGYATRSQK